jgi:hypothetical protein
MCSTLLPADVQLVRWYRDRDVGRDIAVGIDDEITIPKQRHADSVDGLALNRVISLVAIGLNRARAPRFCCRSDQTAGHQRNGQQPQPFANGQHTDRPP